MIFRPIMSIGTGAAFANAVTQRHNILHETNYQLCYACEGTGTSVMCTNIGNPYECEGYVLPTKAEWEYAARSGTVQDIWTGGGTELGGDFSGNSCSDSILILDGEDNPTLGDYAWFCGNSGTTTREVAQNIPNGFGLFDMHGNVWEWTGEWHSSSLDMCTYPQSTVDPFCDSGTTRVLSGGHWDGTPTLMKSSSHGAALLKIETTLWFRIGTHSI